MEPLMLERLVLTFSAVLHTKMVWAQLSNFIHLKALRKGLPEGLKEAF